MRISVAKALPFAMLSCMLFVASRSEASTVDATLKAPSSRLQAPSFSLSDASGGTQTLAEYRGKVVVLNFWATECGGCRLEIPWIVDLQHTFRTKDVAVVGVSLDVSYESLRNAAEAWARVKPFVKAHEITYPILMGDDEVTKRYAIEALPVTFLIDLRGRIAATYVGLLDKQNVQANITSLLSERR